MSVAERCQLRCPHEARTVRTAPVSVPFSRALNLLLLPFVDDYASFHAVGFAEHLSLLKHVNCVGDFSKCSIGYFVQQTGKAKGRYPA